MKINKSLRRTVRCKLFLMILHEACYMLSDSSYLTVGIILLPKNVIVNFLLAHYLLIMARFW